MPVKHKKTKCLKMLVKKMLENVCETNKNIMLENSWKIKQQQQKHAEVIPRIIKK